MAIFKLGRETKKETIEDRLNRAINLGRREALKEILEWLENGTTDTSDEYANPMVAFITFDYKKQMLQAFKEQFNTE